MPEFKLTPPEARQKLCEALRSGKYKQGRGMLCGELGHCCWGVACEVFLQHEDGLEKKQCGRAYTFSSGPKEDCYAMPPEIVMRWTGIYPSDEPSASNLVTMNDYMEATFSQIADFIEQNENLVAY